jgi:hypothetical protein
MGDIAPSKNTQLKNVVINVEPFNDERRSVSQNSLAFTDDRQTKVNGKCVCVNSEKKYKPDVGREIAATIAAHFKQRGAYKDALNDSKAVADYSLTGTIRQFYGQQDCSIAAAVGSAFGVVGTLATMGVTTPGIIRIEITQLRLIDKTGTEVKVFADINKSYSEELRADAHCLMTHVNVLEKLKEIVDGLSDQIELTIIERRNNIINKRE